MRLSILHPHELVESDLARWDSYTSADRRLTSPFLTSTFAQVIGRHRAVARVAVLEDGERVAYLPFEADHERVGHLFGGGLSDQQALIGPSDFDCDLSALARRLRVRELRFDHLVGPLAPFAPYISSRWPSYVIDVSRGYELYERERSVSSNILKKTSSIRRRLARDGEIEVTWNSADAEDFDLLFRWKALQYERTGVRNVFADKWVLDVLHELHAIDSPDCSTRLAVLKAGGRVVALHLGLVRFGVLASWFPAYDPDFSAFSPGNILLRAVAEMAPDHGIRAIDLGRGTQQYKERFANASYEVADGRVPARGGAFRAAILLRHPGWLARRIRRVRLG